MEIPVEESPDPPQEITSSGGITLRLFRPPPPPPPAQEQEQEEEDPE